MQCSDDEALTMKVTHTARNISSMSCEASRTEDMYPVVRLCPVDSLGNGLSTQTDASIASILCHFYLELLSACNGSSLAPDHATSRIASVYGLLNASEAVLSPLCLDRRELRLRSGIPRSVYLHRLVHHRSCPSARLCFPTRRYSYWTDHHARQLFVNSRCQRLSCYLLFQNRSADWMGCYRNRPNVRFCYWHGNSS